MEESAWLISTSAPCTSGVAGSWEAIARQRGLKNRGEGSALCLPTATGSLHKAVVSGDSDAYLVEEIQLFPDPEPVRNLQLAPTQVSRDLIL